MTMAAGVVRSVDRLREMFEAVAAQAIVLAPELHLSALPPLTAVQPHVVFVNPQPNAGDVYSDGSFCLPGEVALTKSALMRLMAAANISPTNSVAERPAGADAYLWRHSVVLHGRGMDGLWRVVPATKEVDLRDGAPDTFTRKGPLSSSALANARRHAAANAETKAILRALRAFLGVRQKYPAAELQKPFVVPVLVPDLDMGDPAQKQAAIAMALGATNALYGAPVAPQASPMVSPPPGSEANPLRLEAPPDEAPEALAPTLVGGDVDDIPAVEAAPTPCCGCACHLGEVVDLTPEFAQRTAEWSGGPVLCPECIPGRSYVPERHASLMRLNFPAHPELETPDAAAAFAARQRRKGGGA